MESLRDLSATSDIKALWPVYKAQFKKNYTEEEDNERFELFKESCNKVIEHNEKYAKGEVTYSMGLNQFSDLKTHEKGCCGVLKPQ